jgi:hypothetical protein
MFLWTSASSWTCSQYSCESALHPACQIVQSVVRWREPHVNMLYVMCSPMFFNVLGTHTESFLAFLPLFIYCRSIYVEHNYYNSLLDYLSCASFSIHIEKHVKGELRYLLAYYVIYSSRASALWSSQMQYVNVWTEEETLSLSLCFNFMHFPQDHLISKAVVTLLERCIEWVQLLILPSIICRGGDTSNLGT